MTKLFKQYARQLLKKGFTPHHFSLKNGEGFTLTEMTVVITIFVLIIITVYLVYVLNQGVYLAGEEIAEITQNGRVILGRMTREIRQAKEIVTELPEERISPPNEIIFQDGHLSLVSEEGIAQGGTSSTITLASTASTIDNYYKDMFVIVNGSGTGQVKKIISYDGATQTAEVETDWETVPDGNSTYKIDTSYYYIRYFRDADYNYILREVFTYCRSDLETPTICASPEIYIPWDAVSPLALPLEDPRIIGEYLTDLEFWGSEIINIALTLEGRDKTVDFQTKIFGRNL